LIKVQQDILYRVSDKIPLLEGGRDDARLVVRTDATVNCTGSPFRQLRPSCGVLLFDEIKFELTTYVTQSLFHYDRGKNLDLALAVESMMTARRHIATRPVGAPALSVSVLTNDAPSSETAAKRGDALKNGDVFKCILSPFVTFELVGSEPSVRTNAVRINLQPKPSEKTHEGLSAQH
jgi:hypothetical protein